MHAFLPITSTSASSLESCIVFQKAADWGRRWKGEGGGCRVFGVCCWFSTQARPYNGNDRTERTLTHWQLRQSSWELLKVEFKLIYKFEIHNNYKVLINLYSWINEHSAKQKGRYSSKANSSLYYLSLNLRRDLFSIWFCMSHTLNLFHRQECY